MSESILLFFGQVQDLLHPPLQCELPAHSDAVHERQWRWTENLQSFESATVAGQLQQWGTRTRRCSKRLWLYSTTHACVACYLRFSFDTILHVFFQILLLVSRQTGQISSGSDSSDATNERYPASLTLGLSALSVILFWMFLPHIAVCSVIYLGWKLQQHIHWVHLNLAQLITYTVSFNQWLFFSSTGESVTVLRTINDECLTNFSVCMTINLSKMRTPLSLSDLQQSIHPYFDIHSSKWL